MKKILFNGLCINGNLSGVQYYAEQIISQGLSCNGGIVFKHVVPLSAAHLVSSNTKNVIQVNIRNRTHRILYEHTILKKVYRKTGSDVLHCPSYIMPYRIAGNTVITVHDIIALQYPQFCKNTNMAYFNAMLGYSIRNSSHIIAVSETVKSDILERFDIDPTKITVLYHGVDPIFSLNGDESEAAAVKIKYGLPDRYMLFVGNIEPKKNLLNLVKAVELLSRRTYFGHKLIIAGQLGWKYKDLMQYIHKSGLEEQVYFTGYIPKVHLPYLYSMADLFVFPSFYEGFGIPPLEAMACGTPVLATRTGAVYEVTAGVCAYTDPYDPNDIAAGIDKCINDGQWRKESVEAGKKHSATFTWEKAWNETLKIYNR